MSHFRFEQPTHDRSLERGEHAVGANRSASVRQPDTNSSIHAGLSSALRTLLSSLDSGVYEVSSFGLLGMGVCFLVSPTFDRTQNS